MIREITPDGLEGRLRFQIESWFPSWARDRLVILEIGPRVAYDRCHILAALHASEPDLERVAPSLLPNHGTEVVLYGEDESDQSPWRAASTLERLRYGGVYVLRGGKTRWLSEGLWRQSGLVPADGLSALLPEPQATAERSLKAA